jgi:hypothetical protein
MYKKAVERTCYIDLWKTAGSARTFLRRCGAAILATVPTIHWGCIAVGVVAVVSHLIAAVRLPSA